MTIKLQRICVPVDFSETSQAALMYAKALADAFGACLHVMHVLVAWVPNADFPASPELYASLEESARKQLEAQLTAEEKAKYQAKVDLVMGTSEFVEVIR